MHASSASSSILIIVVAFPHTPQDGLMYKNHPLKIRRPNDYKPELVRAIASVSLISSFLSFSGDVTPVHP